MVGRGSNGALMSLWVECCIVFQAKVPRQSSGFCKFFLFFFFLNNRSQNGTLYAIATPFHFLSAFLSSPTFSNRPFGWRIDHRLLRVHYFRRSPEKELLTYDYKFSRTNEKTNRSFTDKLKTPAIEKGIGLQLASLKPFSLSDERPVIPRTTSRYFSFRSFSNKWSS